MKKYHTDKEDPEIHHGNFDGVIEQIVVLMTYVCEKKKTHTRL